MRMLEYAYRIILKKRIVLLPLLFAILLYPTYAQDSTAVVPNSDTIITKPKAHVRNNGVGLLFAELYGIQASYMRRLSDAVFLRFNASASTYSSPQATEVSYHFSQAFGVTFLKDQSSRLSGFVGLHQYKRSIAKEELDIVNSSEVSGSRTGFTPFFGVGVEIFIIPELTCNIDVIYDDLIFRSPENSLLMFSTIPFSLRTLTFGLNYLF